MSDHENDSDMIEIKDVFDTTENVTEEDFGRITKEKETILTDVRTGHHELEQYKISDAKEAENEKETVDENNVKDDILEDETNIQSENVENYKTIISKDREEVFTKPKNKAHSINRYTGKQFEPILYGMPKYVRLMKIGPATYRKGIP